MPWDSFNLNLEALRFVVENDNAMKVFCLAKWDRALTVRREFRHRTEININEFPVALMTRPSMTPDRSTAGLVYRTHTVRFYMGFKQDDRAKAQEQLVELEEILELAVLTFDDSPEADEMLITSEDSVNDEGFFHPIYFFAKEFTILTEREV